MLRVDLWDLSFLCTNYARMLDGGIFMDTHSHTYTHTAEYI